MDLCVYQITVTAEALSCNFQQSKAIANGENSMSQIICSIGLVLDVAGVAVLFVYGPPQPDFQEDDVVIVSNQAQQAAARTLKNKFKFRSRIGLSLLFAGFLLQLLGVWCQ